MKLKLNYTMVLVILLFMFSFTYAEAIPETCVGNTINQIGSIILLLVIVVLIIAIAYVLGQTFGNQRAVIWAKSETYNLVISILLIIFLTIFINFSCMAVDGDIRALPDFYLQNLEQQGRVIIEDLNRESIEDQFEATDYFYLGLGIKGRGKGYSSNYLAHSAHKEMIIGIAMNALTSIQLQIFLMEFIQTGIIYTWFIPAALLFRLFPPTRSIGNILIVSCFAIMVILPATYVMYWQGFDITAGSVDTSADGIGSHYEISDFRHDGKDDPAVKQLDDLAKILPQAIFFPNLSLVICITFITTAYKGLDSLTGIDPLTGRFRRYM